MASKHFHSDYDQFILTVTLAKKVMRWKCWDGEGDWLDNSGDTMFAYQPVEGGVNVYENGSEDVTHRWNPAESIEDAWRLLDALSAERDHNGLPIYECAVLTSGRGHSIEIRRWERSSNPMEGDPHTRRIRKTIVVQHGPTAALAICLGTLRAAEVPRHA